MEIIDNKCKNCAGELHYDPESQELKCLQCSSIVNIPEEPARSEKKLYTPTCNITQSQNEYTQYTCKACGRKHVTPINQDVLSCPSCGYNDLDKVNEVDYIPDGIIPFKLNQEKALVCFKDWIKRRKFAPNSLKRLAKTQCLTGLYLPIYNYDFIAQTHYSGVGVNTYKDKDGRSRSTRTHFSSSRIDNYVNYIEAANSTIPSSVLREMSNFNFNDIYVYRPEFLYGWIGSKVDIDIHDSCTRAKNSASSEIRTRVRNSLHYDRIENFVCNTNFENMRYNYLYVPVWINNYKYKDKTYNCYINGITGKVSGNSPKSFWKILFTVLGICALVGGLVFLAYYLSA